jgi:hypothetical protein
MLPADLFLRNIQEINGAVKHSNREFFRPIKISEPAGEPEYGSKALL